MEIYLVGGAVRDELLGRDVLERDWVVVGADESAMLARGFQPKHSAFPVYLHPRTGDEYALARTESKVAAGHRGFVLDSGPQVSLETDLKRRDLTINAMAKASDGRIIAPHGGRDDIDRRILRHITPAFVDDPLRLLRLARFHAQLWDYDFTIADETEQLARRISHGGELSALSGTRVWNETAKALASSHPRVYLEDLLRWGALEQVLPTLLTNAGSPSERAMSALGIPCEGRHCDVPALRLAMLCTSAWESRDGDIDELRRLASITAAQLGLSKRQREILFCAANALPPKQCDAKQLLNWLEALDGLRQPNRVLAALEVRQALGDVDARIAQVWCRALDAARRARPEAQRRSDRHAVRAARLSAISHVLSAPD